MIGKESGNVNKFVLDFAPCRYIGVGDNETVQLFYYFVESQRSPSQDPLLIWLSAGPGCSGLSDFFFESGMFLIPAFIFGKRVLSKAYYVDALQTYLKSYSIVTFFCRVYLIVF